MNRRRPFLRLFVLLWLAGVAVPALAQRSAEVPDSLHHDAPHALGAEEIRASGSVRVSEQLRMIPGLAMWSQDRYTLRMLGTGQQGLLSGEPAIELDGLVIPAAFLDRTLTETLPVSPVSMTSIRYDAGQRSHDGARLRDGTVRIQTPMLRGFEVRGALAVINETGDPGPAKHLDGRLQNVDRSGPATSLAAGWGNGTWSFEGGLQSDLHHLTDERIAGRVRLTYAEVVQPVITQFSPFFRVRGRTGVWQVDAAGGRSWRKDFLYHESAGWEWPVRWTRNWTAARVAWQPGTVRLGLQADGWTMDSGNRPSFIDVPAALSIGEGQAGLFAGWFGKQWTFSVGGGARLLQASQSGRDKSAVLPTADATLSFSDDAWRAGWRLTGLLPDDAWAQDQAWSGAASVFVGRTGAKGRWELRIDAESGHFPEASQLSQWAAWRFDMGEWMSLPSLPMGLATPRLLQGQWLVERPVGAWTGWFSLEGRWMDGVLLQDRVIDQPFGLGPMLIDWDWSSGHSGWLFFRTVGVRRLQPDRIQWRAQFQFHHFSSQGDDTLFRAATGFPRNRVWISAGEERPGGIRWFIRAAWQGEWTWSQYREPARRLMDPALWLDATVGKTLFSGHVEALVSLLNLPDRPLMTHPAGVEEQMAVRLTVLLSSRPRSTR